MKRKRILVVEDNSVDELLTMRALKQCNMADAVQMAKDGDEALEYLFATGKYEERDVNDLPEIVILDLKLPTISGLEVLERIRENESTKLLPVIILTSSDQEEEKIESYRLGANSFVRKPMQFSDFIMAVTKLGRYWLATSESPFNTK
ncbi:response regulator [bacterium]|nr:response regulator [bacterium]